MLDKIRAFLKDLSLGEPATHFEDDDYRLATAALMIHTLDVDGQISAVERAALRQALKDEYQLGDDATATLIEEATAAEDEAVDLYRFTSLLGRALDEEGRLKVIEMMWRLVYADGKVNEFEDNLIWRVADLLAIAPRQRLELRKRVAATAGGITAGEPPLE